MNQLAMVLQMSDDSVIEDAQTLGRSERLRSIGVENEPSAIESCAASAALALATIAFWVWLAAGGLPAGATTVPVPLLALLAYGSGVLVAVLLAPSPHAQYMAGATRHAIELARVQREIGRRPLTADENSLFVQK